MSGQPRIGRRSYQLGGGRGGCDVERMESRAHGRCPERQICLHWPFMVALSNSVQSIREVTSITASQNSGVAAQRVVACGSHFTVLGDVWFYL